MTAASSASSETCTPRFSATFVKAMASARQGYPKISRLLHQRAAASSKGSEDFFAVWRPKLLAHRHSVAAADADDRQVVIKAPARPVSSARASSTGCRTSSRCPGWSRDPVHTEASPVTGAWSTRTGAGVVHRAGMGGSSNLGRPLAPGRAVI